MGYYLPTGQCPCWGTVAVDRDNPYRHQVTDIAPPPPPQVTEHRFYQGSCQSCGQRHYSQWPDGVPSGQMGAGLIAWIVVLSGQFHLSMRSIQRLLREAWHVSFSLGAISQAQGKAIDWMGPLYRQVGDHVRQQAVAHADETRHYRGSQTYWLWTLASGPFSFFMTHYSRGKQAASALLGHFSGYLVTDHFSGYNDVPTHRRQLCWAHLIRHFRNIAERRGAAGAIGKCLLLLAHAVVRIHHRFSQQPDPYGHYRRRLHRLRRRFQATLQRGSQLDERTCKRTRNQCLHLLRDGAMCWTFLQDRRIPLTNNRAERAIRLYVLGTACQLGISTVALMREVCSQGLVNQPVTVRFPMPAQESQRLT